MFIDSFYRLYYPDGATHLDNFPEGLRSVLHEPLGSSFFGNGCVVNIFLPSNYNLRNNRSKRLFWLQMQTNISIVNLAISDLCMMTTQGLPCLIYAFDSDHCSDVCAPLVSQISSFQLFQKLWLKNSVVLAHQRKWRIQRREKN